MRKDLRGKIIILLGVLILAVFFAFPIEKRINLGLDLKGGMHLILRVKTEQIAEKDRSDAVSRAIEILRNRIDSLGAGETVIQRQGNDQILIQLPGITDRDRAIAIIGKVASLEFHLVHSDPMKIKEALAGNVPDGYILKNVQDSNESLLLSKTVDLKGEYISDARVDFDQFGQPQISLVLNAQGTKIFARLTQEHVNERLAIVVDDIVLSAPNINEPILSGRGEITGNFTFEEASRLALQLRSGALPAPMYIEEERTIGPLLGRDSIEAGLKATLIGGALVFLFMILYYFKAGFIADIALIFNILIIVGTLGFLKAMLPDSQITLTLPGIAGIILTIGMAVDANILINERIREEIENKRPIQAAITNGFSKAFSAIFDSNVTTLIAAFMLFQFGSGPIKGFAVTLSIGLISSLFTALFVTRTFFHLFANFNLLKKLSMSNFFSRTKINFISKRYVAYALSVILIIFGLMSWINKKEQAYGIDFSGGQIQEYRFAQPVQTEDLRRIFRENNLGGIIIQRFEKSPNTIILRTAEDTYDQVVAVIKEKLPGSPFDVLRVEKVGPVVGKALRKSALLAILFALGGILVFVGFRFKHFDFATAGVIALLHDVIITLGLVLMTNRQVDLLVVTALLTIAGYSINDTIVIYDRIRENLLKMPKAPLADVMNTSINQTLGRTVLTTLTTLLVVLSLYLFGGEVLNTFAFCLLIGFISGTYSSIFIASPLVLTMQKKKRRHV
ncbi:MAG: protein translocase subunit SecD [Candidatus Omnitrophota bacterium]